MGVEVKICGITNERDAFNSLQAGANYLGFILYPESPVTLLWKMYNGFSKA